MNGNGHDHDVELLTLERKKVTVRSGSKFRRHDNEGKPGDLYMLVSVPMADGTYTLTASRWILVCMRLGWTWSNVFHKTPAEALNLKQAPAGSWSLETEA